MGAEVQNTWVGLKYIRQPEAEAPKFVRQGAAGLSMVSCQAAGREPYFKLEAGENARPGASPLVLRAGKADASGCRARSSVSAAKAAPGSGQQRDVPSRGREQQGEFISRQGCMEALWCKGSSPGPGALCHWAARAGSSPTPSTDAGDLFSSLPAQVGWDAGLVVAPSGEGDCGSSRGLPPWPRVHGAWVGGSWLSSPGTSTRVLLWASPWCWLPLNLVVHMSARSWRLRALCPSFRGSLGDCLCLDFTLEEWFCFFLDFKSKLQKG